MRIVRRLMLAVVLLGLVLVGGLAIAAYLVDVPGLIERYKPQALAAASQALDREVELGGVEATWFPTLGLRAEDLRIGDAPLSQTPTAIPPGARERAFVELGRFEVGIAVWPALISLGRDVEIRTIRLDHPTVHLTRYPDGSFNFSTLGGPSEPAAEPAPEPEPEAEGSILERFTRAVIQSIRITEGSITYEDLGPEAGPPIVLDALGLNADGVGLGQPVLATLETALGGGETPNLRLSVETGPLAAKITELGAPALRDVHLELIELPLSALPVKLTGIDPSAMLATDIHLEPAGEGLELRGPLGATGLVLTSPEGRGRAFDAALQLSVKTSTAFDRFTLDGTTLQLADLGVGLSGQVVLSALGPRWTGLKLGSKAPVNLRSLLGILPGPAPEVPAGRIGLQLGSSGGLGSASSTLHLDWRGFAYEQPGLKADGQLSLDARVDGAPSQPQVRAVLDVSGIGVEGEGYRKPADMVTRLETEVRVGETRLEIPRAELRLGEAKLDAKGAYPLSGVGKGHVDIALAPVALAPLMSQMGLPTESLPGGSTLSLVAGYDVDGSKPGSDQIRLSKLVYRAGKSRFSAVGSVDKLNPLRARLDGEAEYLDLDALLGTGEAADEAPPPPAEDEEAPLLPESMRSAQVRTTLEVRRLRYSGINMRNVDVELLLEKGVLRVKKTRMSIFGGRIVADGTTLNLASTPIRYNVAAQIDKVDGTELLDRFIGLGDAVGGKLDTDLQLRGEGLSLEQIGSNLNGAFSLEMLKGRLDGVNLLGSTLTPLQAALPFTGSKSSFNTDKLVTEFERMAGSFEVQEGQIRTKAPLRIRTKQGDIELQGGMGVDGKLNFDGTIQVPSSLIRKLTGGKVRPRGATPLGFGIGCSLTKPCVRDVKADSVAAALAKTALGAVAEEALGKQLGGQVGGTVGKVLGGGTEAAKAEAEAKAKEEAEKAKAKAEEEANKAKAKAEAEAKAQAEEAAKKAKDEAAKKLKSLFGR